MICIGTNIACLLKIYDLERSLKRIENEYHIVIESVMYNFQNIEDKIDNIIEKNELKKLQEELDRSLQANREALEAAKPMKTNNWDSVREAFRVAPKVENDVGNRVK